MQRFFSSLLVLMLYVLSSNASAQQFDSFRHIGEASGIAAGTVTSITLAPTTSQISYFNAAGLSTVFDVILTPSNIIRDGVTIYMPSADFGAANRDTLSDPQSNQASLNLEDTKFFTGTLVNTQDRQGDVPAHWFRITYHDGIWSGVFRIADRIYSVDRSQRDNIVEVRSTPSTNTELLPTRQIKLTALIDESYVYADTPGDSVGLDSIGHVYALESLHVMDGILTDSLGMSLRLDQLIYRDAIEIASPSQWLAQNSESFGIDDNYATFVFSGDAEAGIGANFVQQNKAGYSQLSTAHNFGKLLGLPEENSTLQSASNPLNVAHWSSAQQDYLLANLPNPQLVQLISSDAPLIEITEPDVINEIPQSILDSEIVETDSDAGTPDSIGLQNDEAIDNTEQFDSAKIAAASSGGGSLSAVQIIALLMLLTVTYRRQILKQRQPAVLHL